MDEMLSDFYAKFQESLKACAEPAPDREKFEIVFALLSNVKEWKEPKTVGKRVYDDKAFVESVRSQFESGAKPMSAKQLEYLVRMALMYEQQIPGCSAALKEGGLTGPQTPKPETVDNELVKWCFEVAERIGGLLKNPFHKSLKDQFDRGRGLSPKQFAILARAVGENAGVLPDCNEIRARLLEFVPAGFGAPRVEDPTIPAVLGLLAKVKDWRPSAKKGRKVYDDQSFVKSLSDQYERRRTLSPRQLIALKRVAFSYRDQIPNFADAAAKLGIKDPTSDKTRKRRGRQRSSGVANASEDES
jgi:hypothetical protein